MTAIYILNAMSPITLDQDKAAINIEVAAVYVALNNIPDDTIGTISRRELAKALYAGHLFSQSGILSPVLSENFDGGSVSFQAFNLGDKDGASTWYQEFSKLIPDFHSPMAII